MGTKDVGTSTDDPDDVVVPDTGEPDVVTPVDTTSPFDDTFQGADTALDTDPDEDNAITPTTPPNIHSGVHQPGQLLEVRGTVTAVRQRTDPPASNGFTLQVPDTAVSAAVYIFVRDTSALPALGDEVRVVGHYQEIPVAAPSPYQTQSRLEVHPSVPFTEFEILGVGAPITPVVLDVASLSLPVTAELYESMLVTLEEAEPLVVATNPIPSIGEFRVSAIDGTDRVLVDEHFFDVRTLFDVSIGDRLESLTGALMFEVNGYKIAPRDAFDVGSWSEP